MKARTKAKDESAREILAKNIRRCAAARGMSLDSVADFAGVSRSHLHAVLACDRSATVDWVAKIATSLETEPYLLLRPVP